MPASTCLRPTNTKKGNTISIPSPLKNVSTYIRKEHHSHGQLEEQPLLYKWCERLTLQLTTVKHITVSTAQRQGREGHHLVLSLRGMLVRTLTSRDMGLTVTRVEPTPLLTVHLIHTSSASQCAWPQCSYSAHQHYHGNSAAPHKYNNSTASTVSLLKVIDLLIIQADSTQVHKLPSAVDSIKQQHHAASFVFAAKQQARCVNYLPKSTYTVTSVSCVHALALLRISCTFRAMSG